MRPWPFPLAILGGGPLMPSDLQRTLLLIPFLICAAPGADKFDWPDSRQNGLVFVNANQDIATYVRNHPDWFRRGDLVVDLSVANYADSEAAVRERTDILRLLDAKGITAGTYTSGTTVEPLANIKLWPYDKVPVEWLPKGFAITGSWPGDPERKIIDVKDKGARQALQDGIRRLWRESGAPLRFVDNAASHSSTGGTEPWPAYCANIHDIRLLGEALGSRLVFNVSVHLALLSDVEAGQLMEAVGSGNGILLEDPWGQAIRKNPELTHKARARYRQLLDAGIAVIALPLNIPTGTLLDWMNSWRKPADRLYIGWSFWRKWDGVRPWEATPLKDR